MAETRVESAGRAATSRRVATDLKLLAPTIALMLLVTSIPPAIARLTAPPDRWFAGITYNVHDAAQYLSWMREARQGLFTENRLTSEPNPAVFLNLHWWLAGRAGAALGLSLAATYEAFRLVAAPLLLVGLYAWSAVLFPPGGRRTTCFLLATLSSGLGWVLVVLKQFTGELIFPHDVYLMMGNSFFTMVASPHLTFGAALTVLTLLAAYRAGEGVSPTAAPRTGLPAAVAAGALALFLGLGHIYDLVTVWGVVAAAALLGVLREGWSWRRVAPAALIIAISAPAALYWGWVSSGANPTWREALAQYDNLGVYSPDPFHLILLLWLPLLLALSSYLAPAPRVEGRPDRGIAFMRVWLAVTLAAIYLPVRFQAMLLTGIQLPLAALATWCLYDAVLPWLRAHGSRAGAGARLRARLVRWAPALLLLAVLPTNLYLLAWRVVDLSRHDYPYYLHRDDVAALAWLEREAGRDEVVLSSFTIGHYLPGLTGRRAYLSNAVMTLDFVRKRALTEAFWGAEVDDAWRAELVRAEGIDYLYWGPAERAAAAYNPAGSDLFSEVYRGGETRIYAPRH